eukprot:2992378-Amphidinium_carterae.1
MMLGRIGSAVCSLAVTVFMLLVALVFTMDIFDELHANKLCMIVPAHLLAQACAWERIRRAMYRDEVAVDRWNLAAALGSVLVDWVQFVALLQRFKQSRANWLEVSCLMSLLSVFFADFVGTLLVSIASKAHVQVLHPPPRLPVDTFTFKKDAVGKQAFTEQPCLICLEELAEGEEGMELI